MNVKQNWWIVLILGGAVVYVLSLVWQQLSTANVKTYAAQNKCWKPGAGCDCVAPAGDVPASAAAFSCGAAPVGATCSCIF